MVSYLSRFFVAALLVLTTTVASALCETLFHPQAHSEAACVEGHGDAHHHDEAEGGDGHSHDRQQEDTCCSKLLSAYYLQAATPRHEGLARVLTHGVPFHADFPCPTVVDGALPQKNIALCKNLCRGPSLSVPLYDLFDAYRI